MDEIRVLRGAPSEEEMAAVVAVLVSRRAATTAAAPVSRWARSARPPAALRGPGAWRASALPR